MALTAHDRLALRRALAAEFSRLAAAYRHLADLEAVPGWHESLDDEGQEAASADYRRVSDAAREWAGAADDYARSQPLPRGPVPAEPEPELAAVAFAAAEATLLRVRAQRATAEAWSAWNDAGGTDAPDATESAYDDAFDQEDQAHAAEEAAWVAFSDFVGVAGVFPL